jgi:hypothetical protein
MMINKTLVACSLALILSGCGGGSDSQGGTTPAPTPTPTPVPTVVNTADIVASPDFSFRIDMDLTLEITEVPAGKGVVNVYYDFDFHDVATDTYYPKPDTRVLTFHPQATNSVVFQVNKNWDHLVFEYIPTDGTGLEMYKKVDLSTDDMLSFKFGN